jgi:hypothetical protein
VDGHGRINRCASVVGFYTRQVCGQRAFGATELRAREPAAWQVTRVGFEEPQQAGDLARVADGVSAVQGMTVCLESMSTSVFSPLMLAIIWTPPCRHRPNSEIITSGQRAAEGNAIAETGVSSEDFDMLSRDMETAVVWRAVSSHFACQIRFLEGYCG